MKEERILSGTPATLRELIIDLVSINVDRYNNKSVKKAMIDFLSPGEIEDQATVGKVGFGARYNEKQADREEAVLTALQAFTKRT